jgi:DNA modification methylase
LFILGESAFTLKAIRDDSIDLTVTSPPYDNMRTYGGFTFDFETIALHLYRVTKPGGIVVWIVNDQTVEGDESGTSFRQALYFKEIGFKLHDTMIFSKNGFAKPSSNRYHQTFEYMFILAKGFVKTFNPIQDRAVKYARVTRTSTLRQVDGTTKDHTGVYGTFGNRYNIWLYDTNYNGVEFDKLQCKHPASFPFTLAADHIKSWSNVGDLVLDPFCGSGTTCKAAATLKRNWIGIEINPEYIKICKKRLEPLMNNLTMENFV